jgi:hypothetical protein
MGYAVELYDALVGINVPKDKASSVITALENTIASELATKADVQLLRVEMMQQFAVERERTDRSIEALKASVHTDMIALEQRLTLRLGGMMATMIGLLFLALRFT